MIKERENYYSSILHTYIPYDDRGETEDGRKFYRRDTKEEVIVKLDIKSLPLRKTKDFEFKYYGNSKKNEWENTKADEALRIVSSASQVEYGWNHSVPVLISRLNINLLKNSGYSFAPSLDHIDGDGFILKDHTIFLNVRKTNGYSKALVFPQTINKIIPGAFEDIYIRARTF